MAPVVRLAEEYSDIALRVDQALEALQGELDITANPHQLALKSLGWTYNLGYTPSPYNDDAFNLMSELLSRSNGEDVEAKHRLAIMHHARAIDLEGDGKADASDADWEAALRYWYELCESDAFWDRIADAACKSGKRDPVDELRMQCPELILRIQYDIAFHPDTKVSRARYHVKSVLGSPFSDEIKNEVRRGVYGRCTGELPVELWREDVLDPDVIKEGVKVISSFLELDPGCVPALEDALRLQVRMMTHIYTELQAVSGDDSKRTGFLNSLRESCDDWYEFFEQLVFVADTLDEDIRYKLCLWCRVMGQTLFALGEHERAADLYDHGVLAGCEEDDEWRRCSNALGYTHAYIAREYAHGGRAGARHYCDQVRERDDLCVSAHFILANAYSLLHEFDIAEDVCRKGIAIEPDISNEEEFDNNERDRRNLYDMLDSVKRERRRYQVHQLLNKATDYLRDENFVKAIPLLDMAVDLDPEEEASYFLRCQCNLALDNVYAAQKDLEAFKRFAGDAKEAGEMLVSIERIIAEKVALLDKFGDAALRLRGQASRAAGNNRYEEAVALLRQAVECCNKDGRAAIGKDLAMFLTNWAVNSVNDVMEKDSKSDDTKLKVCKKALSYLEEAGKADPDSAHVKSNKVQLKQLVDNLEESAKYAHEKAKLLAEFGSERVLELRFKAVQAFNENKFGKAVTHLREALGETSFSSGRRKIESELSMALTADAVTMVQKEGAGANSRVLLDARKMLEEAARLDPLNQQAVINLEMLNRLPF